MIVLSLFFSTLLFASSSVFFAFFTEFFRLHPSFHPFHLYLTFHDSAEECRIYSRLLHFSTLPEPSFESSTFLRFPPQAGTFFPFQASNHILDLVRWKFSDYGFDSSIHLGGISMQILSFDAACHSFIFGAQTVWFLTRLILLLVLDVCAFFTASYITTFSLRQSILPEVCQLITKKSVECFTIMRSYLFCRIV